MAELSPEEEIRRLKAELEELKAVNAAPARSWNTEMERDWEKRQEALESWLGGSDGELHDGTMASWWHPDAAMEPQLADTVRRAVRDLHDNGYAIVEGFLNDEQLNRVRDGMEPLFEGVRAMFPRGPGELYADDPAKGRQTKHLQNVFAKSRAADEVATHPVLRAILAGTLSPDFIMNAGAVAMNPDPGCTKQGLHRDDGFFPLPRPRMPVVVTVAVALDDFHPENGSTQIVPGAHLWPESRTPNVSIVPGQSEELEVVQHTMPAGSMLLWDGAVLHGGGANTTQDQSRRTITLNCTAELPSPFSGLPRPTTQPAARRHPRLATDPVQPVPELAARDGPRAAAGAADGPRLPPLQIRPRLDSGRPGWRRHAGRSHLHRPDERTRR